METATVQAPRQRLFELKSSAEFSSAEFSHSIKTWVNMASLLIKQGNMAESNKDDENAYISYVRACLIITKIIPFQPNYSAMMNDIVCIDLRQKILLVVARIVHLERRLLKQFELDSQELVQQQSQKTQEPAKIHSTHTITPSFSQKQYPSMDETDREIDLEVPRTTFQEIELEATQEEQEEVQEDQDKQDDGDDVEQDVRRLSIAPETDSDLSLDFNPRSYASHYRRSLQRRSRDLLQEQQFQGHDEKAMASSHLTAPAPGSLRKKSSNEEHRSFLTPECQPNSNSNTPSSHDGYPSFASSRHQHLFVQHPHRGAHVRRCSSTDGLRTRMHFPGGHSSPAIPPRSDKRSSMMASVVLNGSNPNPTPRPSLAELRARDGSNRRTMSFEITWTLPHEQKRGLPAAIMTSSTPRQSVDFSHARSVSFSNCNNNSELESPPSSASTNGSTSNPSTAQSTPVASPQLKTGPQLGHGLHNFHGYGHGYSASLTSITSASTSAATMVDGTTPSPTGSTGLLPPHAPPSISSCSMHSNSTVTTPTTPVASPIMASFSTISSMSASTMVNPPSISSTTGSGTWTTTGKKAGLLRKIRSKPKLKDQLFDILPNVGSPAPPPQPTLALGQHR